MKACCKLLATYLSFAINLGPSSCPPYSDYNNNVFQAINIINIVVQKEDKLGFSKLKRDLELLTSLVMLLMQYYSISLVYPRKPHYSFFET